jgi:hypothetical protein
VETDFDAAGGVLHGLLTDQATGKILSDTTVSLADLKYGNYDSSVDGVFNVEAYVDAEISLVESSDPTLTRPGLAVIDNIDSANKHGGNAYGHGYGGNTTWLESIACGQG